MQKEVLSEQFVRIGKQGAKKCGIPEGHTDDCAMSFLHKKLDPDDYFLPIRQGEEERKLVELAEKYARKHLEILRNKAKKEVSLTGADGTEANGPAGNLLSREPGPEEVQLREHIWELIAGVLPNLTDRQRILYKRIFEREERAVDLQEVMGCSADAIRQSRVRLRAHLHKLLVLAGLTDAAASELLNELERLRYSR